MNELKELNISVVALQPAMYNKENSDRKKKEKRKAQFVY